jgi:hypothetical protein
MAVYTNTEPAAASIIAVSQPLLLGNTQYLKTSINSDHNFTSNTATAGDGWHKLVHLIPQVPAGALAGYGRLYAKTDGSGDQQLAYMDNNAVETVLTGDNDPTTNGYVRLGLILIQWGRFTMPGAFTDTTTNVIFPIDFPTDCWILNVQSIKNGAGDTATNIRTSDPSVGVNRLHQFTCYDKGTNKNMFIAIGS